MLSRFTRLVVVVAVAAASAVIPSAATAASIWAPLNSGTSQTISAIAWPTANTLVFATSGGQILHQTSPGVFAQASVPSAPFGFTDIAMSPDGTHGVAVGPSATLFHSTDSGATWTAVPLPTEDRACVQPSNPGTLADDLYSAHFADATTVYVTGDHEDILKSTNGGATFAEANKTVVSGSVQCKEMQNSSQPSEPFTDTAWLDANHGFLLNRYFGDLWVTSDGLTAVIPSRRQELLNSYQEMARLAVSDSTHLWAVSPASGVGSCGDLCFVYSTDGGTTFSSVNYDKQLSALHDISSSGTTVVAVGDGGAIYTSPDGINFSRQVADSPLSTNDWKAVAVLNANTAVVGGAGGKLLVTSKANQIPDTTAPTGTIAGPAKLNAGQFGSYTASAADNAGGSGVDTSSFVWTIPGQATQTGAHVTFGFSNPGTYTVTVAFKDVAGNTGTASITIKVTSTSTGSQPVTKGSGGSTVTIFKKVTAGQGKGRFIPVKLATKKPRRFIVTLLTKNGKHQLATLTTTLKKGHKTVHLRISSKIKSGTYKLVVIVLTTGKHSHPVGGRIKQVFVLR